MNMTPVDPIRILLVEDSEDDYLIVRDLLRDIDAGRYALEWAETYEEGLGAIRAQRHDLILLDYRLSDGTGLELLQETQAVAGRAPVIFMTGQGDHDVDVQAMQAGATDYLVKDRLNADLLERVIRYAVERQKSAEALRVSEDRYRTFVENSTEGIWRFELEQPLPTDRPEPEQIAHLDRYAYVAECNDAMAHIYGFERAVDLVGIRFGEFLWSNEVSEDNFPRRLIRNGYRLVSDEAFEYDRHGQPKYILHNLIGVVEKGLLYRIWGSQSDITERRQAELAQAQLAAIVEASSDAIISTTLDGLIVTWNKGAETVYGYTAQEVTGQPISGVMPADYSGEMDGIIERVGRGEWVDSFDTVRLHKDGRRIDTSVSVSPLVDALGRVNGTSSISRDISKQKQTETRLRQSEANMAAAQRIAHFGSWELDLGNMDDLSANPLLCSDETFRIFGYEPGQVPVTTEFFFRGVPPEDQQAIQQTVAAAVAQRQGYSLVHRVRCPDGEERIVRETGQFFEGETSGQSPRLVGTVHDITEQRRTEEHTRFTALILSQVRNAVIATDLAGCVTYWNQYAETLYQWTADEAIGKNIADLTIAPAHSLQEAEAIRGQMRDTGSWEGEFTVQRKDGSTFPAHVVDTLFREASGAVAGVVGVSIDITERKKALEDLGASRQRLRLTLDGGRFGTFQLDLVTGRYLEISDLCRAQFGMGSGDVSISDFFQRVHPDDRAETQAALTRAAAAQEADFGSEYRITLPAGDIRWISVHGSITYDETGTPTLMLGATQDITERKQSERVLTESRQRLALATESAQIGIWDWDVAANTMFWDKQMYALYGIREQDFDGAYSAWQKGLHPEDRAEGEARIVLALEGSKDFHTQFRVIWPTGEVRSLEAHAIVTRASDGTARRMIGVNWDITERKQAEEERDRTNASLRRSEQRFRSVVETVESLVIHDQQGRLISVNQNACDSLGYTREELLRLRVADYEMRYNAANVGLLWKRMASGEISTIVVEGLHQRKDGSSFPVEVRAGLLETEGDILMVAVARDVTDRNKAQDALREAEQEQRQLAAHLEVERARLAEAQTIAKVGSWELDLRTDVLTWSDETHHIFGSDPAVFQNSYQAFLECIHPDDREDVNTAYRNSVAARTPYEIDHRILKQDGSITFVHERCRTFYDDEARPIRSIGTAQDITANHLMMEALRTSEQRFRRIVETTHEGVLQLDAEARIIYVNRRYCEMLGYTVEELIGRSPFDFMDQESRVLAQRSFEKRRDGLTEQFDRRFRHKDGSVVWGIVSASPLLDNDGRMIGSFSMTTDITERKRLEAQVHRSEKLAALGELVAGVAHEINNPLAAILGNAELLEMHADPQVRADAQTIQRMSHRVTRIVRSLLTFARPQEGSKREEAVNVIVEHALEMTAYKLRTSGVTLALCLREPSPVASANAGEIQQILLNLIVNAEHALRGNVGEKRVVITTGTERDEDGEWATVSVEDNGHGIPEEIRARIFDPFFTTKDIGEGTGLGLAICHGIAESHGGRLSIESAPGLGTTFTLALPSATPAMANQNERG